MIRFEKKNDYYDVYGHHGEVIGQIVQGKFEEFVFLIEKPDDNWSGGTLRLISKFLYDLNNGGILNPNPYNLTVSRNGRVIRGEYSLNVKVVDHD